MSKDLIKKWLQFAKADLEAAEILVLSPKSHHSYQLAVLHCHQAIEKILKTIIVAKNKTPKRVHDLLILAKDTGIVFEKETMQYIKKLNPHYQLPRYPDIFYKGPVLKYTKELAKYHFNQTRKLFLWLEKKLTPKKS